MQKHKFVFGTKAHNLLQLKNFLKQSYICDIVVFTVKQWMDDRQQCIDKVKYKIRNNKIIIRSSALSEDTMHSSMAGFFDSIADIDSNDDLSVIHGVETVIQSYKKIENNIDDFEILIQPMIEDVIRCGVIFTRDLEQFGPYYILNYDEGSNTDSITSGYSYKHKTIRIYKKYPLSKMPSEIKDLLIAVQEVERAVDLEHLDIEFAMNKSGQIYILQVRSMVATKIFSYRYMDNQVDTELGYMERFLEGKFNEKFNTFGEKTIFGQMPDWNPAEIIGPHPKPLASSLYRYVVMKSAWRESRALMGYYNPFPQQLMITLGGKPYVDVRSSFNSFLPSNIPKDLAKKLINYFIERLIEKPELHDKVEFEIVPTCLDFNFDTHRERMEHKGFTQEEINIYKQLLRELTNNIVCDRDGLLNKLNKKVQKLVERRYAIMNCKYSIEDIPMLVEHLLEDCIEFGVISFSVLARCAFIGTTFLKSLRDKNIIEQKNYSDFLSSIDTVATRMIIDLARFQRGEISQKSFLEEYGHLRPGTYDITSYRYDEKPELYLGIGNDNKLKQIQLDVMKNEDSFVFNRVQRGKIDELIHKEGFDFSAEALIDFIRDSIKKRELYKFAFTKNISLALNLIVEMGEFHGIERRDMAFLDIQEILRYSNDSFSSKTADSLKDHIEKNKELFNVMTYIHLPDLITKKDDLQYIEMRQRRPNFITQKSIQAPIICLDEHSHDLEDINLKGKIILIQNADPGYDWIFSKGIAGLITKYGGVASHMAIRCAEFSLPAAIGCGEQLYEKIKSGDSIILNALEMKVEVYEVFK